MSALFLVGALAAGAVAGLEAKKRASSAATETGAGATAPPPIEEMTGYIPYSHMEQIQFARRALIPIQPGSDAVQPAPAAATPAALPASGASLTAAPAKPCATRGTHASLVRAPSLAMRTGPTGRVRFSVL